MAKWLGIWLRRFFRQWLVMVSIIAGGLFLVGDSQGWIEDVTDRDLDQTFIFIAALAAVGVTAIWRLMCLEARIDDRERYRSVLQSLDAFVVSGDSLLNHWGGPPENYALIPMAYMEQGLPALGRWTSEAMHFM